MGSWKNLFWEDLLFDKHFPNEVQNIQLEIDRILADCEYPLSKETLDKVLDLRAHIYYIKTLRSRMAYG